MTVTCIKLKDTLPNIVTRAGSGTSAISKMELFVAIALNWKPLIFVAESSILDRRWHAYLHISNSIKLNYIAFASLGVNSYFAKYCNQRSIRVASSI